MKCNRPLALLCWVTDGPSARRWDAGMLLGPLRHLRLFCVSCELPTPPEPPPRCAPIAVAVWGRTDGRMGLCVPPFPPLPAMALLGPRPTARL